MGLFSEQNGQRGIVGDHAENLFSELSGLMAKYSFTPNKRLAQHFIVNEKIIQRIIAEANLQKTDIVLEIGAGTGFLTRELLKHSSVIAVEKDAALAELLKAELPQEKLQVVCADFLEANLPKFNKIIAFPPYSISSEIIYKLFELEFDSAFLVFQKEFVGKLTAFPGFWEYNAITVLAQYYFELKVICHVGKNSFFPRPKSDSVLLKLETKKMHGKAKNEESFQIFVKTIFRFGNKNLRNALRLSHQFLEKSIKSKKNYLEKIEKIEEGEKKVNLLEVEEIVKVFNDLF